MLQRHPDSFRTTRARLTSALVIASAGPLVAVSVGGALLDHSVDAEAIWLAGLTLIVSVLLVAVVSARLASRLTERLRVLATAARALEAGEDQTPLPLATDGEIGTLVGAFTSMRAAVIAREAALRTSQARYQAIVEDQTDLICRLRPDGTLTFVNDAVCRVMGLTRDVLLGSNFPSLLPVEVREPLRAQLETMHPDAPALTAEHDQTVPGGEIRRLHWTSRAIFDEHGQFVELQAVGRDITDRTQLEAQLARQAFYDTLTGLPNRTLFMDRLGHALAGAERSGQLLAVLFLDLDGFKMVNDSLGHAAGDTLLAEVATRLSALLRPADTVARFGGDEFAILIEDIDGSTRALHIAQRLIDELKAPIALENREVFVAGSIGITIPERDHGPHRAGDLVREADIALYQAKTAGRSRAVLFDPSMMRRAIDRLDLETDLRFAMARGELRLLYQPEVDLDTGRIIGMEALLRWDHPERGRLSPVEFIPIAEETGLIVPIGWWVLDEACRQGLTWQHYHRDGHPVVMSVNISPRQFQEPGLVERVAEALRSSGLPPACLRLEITETMLMDDAPSTAETLQWLKALGVRVAIDDFGTGYSSLSYLRQFAVDTLKIDRSFVTALERDRGSDAIVRAVMTLGESLGLDVTAEGIETSEHLALVKSVGCRVGQGFYHSPPVPSDEMSRLLELGPIQGLDWHDRGAA
jgi:diguanylate cyclase (GGDEF)-like protein/PAS domain S-box-containing protein